MCTDRRFQPWAPCRCKPDKTGPVHHALRQPGVQLDELILKLTQNTQNTQIHSEGYDIFETARNIEAWTGMGYGNSHQLRGSTLLTAKNKQHAQQSISIVTVALL